MRALCVVFAVLLLFSLAAPGHGMPKGVCDGYCSFVCGKTEEWSVNPGCGKMYCCITFPKKLK